MTASPDIRSDEAELVALRAELNAVVDRMNGNENFATGVVSAAIGFLAVHPATALGPAVSLAALFATLVGLRRYVELRAHVRKIDDYLMEVERRLRPGGGWTCRYHEGIAGRTSGGFSDTRWAFWFVLLLAALLTFFAPAALERGDG